MLFEPPYSVINTGFIPTIIRSCKSVEMHLCRMNEYTVLKLKRNYIDYSVRNLRKRDNIHSTGKNCTEVLVANIISPPWPFVEIIIFLYSIFSILISFIRMSFGSIKSSMKK